MAKTHDKKSIDPAWHLIDATRHSLGRLATTASTLLRGKHKTAFTTYLDHGDHVVIINTKNIRLTGQKLLQKRYYSHSGYLGNLKTKKISDIGLDKALYQAIYGMLPSNKLRNKWLAKLHIYLDENHPHQANVAGNKINKSS